MFRIVAYVYHVYKQITDRVLAIYCNVRTSGRNLFEPYSRYCDSEVSTSKRCKIGSKGLKTFKNYRLWSKN